MSMLLVRQHFIPVWCAFSLLLKCAWMLLSLNCCSKLWTSWFYRIRCWFWLEDSDCHSCLEWTMLYFLSCSTCSRSSRATKWSLKMANAEYFLWCNTFLMSVYIIVTSMLYTYVVIRFNHTLCVLYCEIFAARTLELVCCRRRESLWRRKFFWVFEVYMLLPSVYDVRYEWQWCC